MKWDGNTDRRRHKRAPIRIVSEFGDPGSSTRIETADFSAGGFSCWMDHPIQPLTKLALRFEFPAFGDDPASSIGCEAVVVRCEKRREPHHGWGMAAAFVGLSPATHDTIERYVSWHEAVMAPTDAEEAQG
jgi:hypothetical protein